MLVAGNGFVRVVVLMESGSLEDDAQRLSVVEVVVVFFCATVSDQSSAYCTDSMKRMRTSNVGFDAARVVPWRVCVL